MYILQKSVDIAYQLFPTTYKQANWHIACGYIRNKLVGIGLNDMAKPTVKAVYFANRYKSTKKYPYLCAEIDLFQKLWGKIHIDNKLRLVIIRLGFSHNRVIIKNSKPCQSCQRVIAGLGLNRVWFSLEDKLEFGNL